jgi:hypothetical protein
LDQIARSNGKPQRTIAALRLLNTCLERELGRCRPDLKVDSCTDLQQRLRTIAALRLLNAYLVQGESLRQTQLQSDSFTGLQRRLQSTKHGIASFEQTPDATDASGVSLNKVAHN